MIVRVAVNAVSAAGHSGTLHGNVPGCGRSEEVNDHHQHQYHDHHHRDGSASSSHGSDRSKCSGGSDHSSRSQSTNRSGGSRHSYRSNRSQPSNSSSCGDSSTGTASAQTSPETPQNRPQRLFGNATPTVTTPSGSNSSNDSPAAAAPAWNRNRHGPLHSLLGSRYSRSEIGDAKRQTHLPPYTSGLNGTFIPVATISEGSETRFCFATAFDEKADQLKKMLEAAKSGTNLTAPLAESSRTVSGRNLSTQAASNAIPFHRSISLVPEMPSGQVSDPRAMSCRYTVSHPLNAERAA